MRARLLLLREAGADADLVLQWQHLAARAAEPNPFFEPQALLPAARHLPDGGAVRLLLVGDAEGLALVTPLLPQRAYRRVPVPALVAWQHHYAFLGVPLLDPDPRRAERAFAAALALLRTGPGQWLALPRWPVGGPADRALAAVLPGRRTVLDSHDRPVVRRRPRADYLEGRLSARHRKALRRQRRRLAERLGGEVELRDRAGDPGALARLLRLEASGWKGRAGTAIASRPADRAFVEEMCAGFREQGRLQLWLLGTPEADAAGLLALRAGGTVFHVKIGHDEQAAALSPGVQLEVDLVQAFHDDPQVDTLDSCVDAGNRVSAQLYPDRAQLVTLLVPLSWAGSVAVRATPLLARAVHAARRWRS